MAATLWAFVSVLLSSRGNWWTDANRLLFSRCVKWFTRGHGWRAAGKRTVNCQNCFDEDSQTQDFKRNSSFSVSKAVLPQEGTRLKKTNTSKYCNRSVVFFVCFFFIPKEQWGVRTYKSWACLACDSLLCQFISCSCASHFYLLTCNLLIQSQVFSSEADWDYINRYKSITECVYATTPSPEKCG